MDRFSLVAAEHSSSPILIIDKEGSVGTALFARLKEYAQIVLVSGAEPEERQNLLFLPFNKSIPQIPDEQYSHIFIVPETEKELEDFLSSLSTKVAENKGKLIVVLPKKFATNLRLTFLKESGKEVYSLVIGDLFGGVVVSGLKSSIEKLFIAAKKTKKLNLVGMGLRQAYPVEFSDVVTEVIRVGFGRPVGRLFFLLPKNSITELSIAHAIQKVDPMLKIDFRKGSVENKPFQAEEEGEYLLADTYPTIERIQKAYETFVVPQDYVEEENFWEEEGAHYHKPSKKSSPKNILFGLLGFFILLTILPLLTMATGAAIGFGNLIFAKNMLLDGNLSKANIAASVAEQSFVIAERAGSVAVSEIGIFSPQLFNVPLDSINIGKMLAQNLHALVVTAQSGIDGLKTKQFSTNKLQESVSEIKISLLGIQKEMQSSIVPESMKGFVFGKLTEFSPILNTLDFLPEVLGAEKKKTYLVLFQNNMELRPGGGFIGSYGVLTLNKGSVESFNIHDVYDADGLLKGHLEPPFPIRRFVQVHLYLRDSNFSIDFSKNAYTAALLFHQETGTTVDGVIGVDLSFVKNILQSLGSVSVPTFNETVTDDNFFLLTEKHAEKNFFPGSTQKKDFLNSFFTGLQTKLANTKNISYEKLGQEVIRSVVEKHLQVAFNDTGAEDLVIANSFASTLWDTRAKAANGVNDTLSINEANIGFNKVNYFISRNVSQDVTVHDDGKITGAIAVSYTNSDKAAVWPGGPYKNYLRFFLPKGTSVDKIFIDGVEQAMVPAVTIPADYEAKGFVSPKGLEVEKEEEGEMVYYGILTQILPGQTQKITVLYALSQTVDINQPVFSYSQWLLKQPGTDVYPASFSISIPEGYKVLESKNLRAENSVLSFSGNQTKDIILSFRAGKK